MNQIHKIVAFFSVLIFIGTACSSNGNQTFENIPAITQGAAAPEVQNHIEQNNLRNDALFSTLEALKSNAEINDYFYARYKKISSMNYATVQEEDKAALEMKKAAENEFTNIIRIRSKNDNDYYRPQYFVAKLLYDSLINSKDIAVADLEYGEVTLKDYDYRLQFKGFKDILISLKEREFYFEGEKTVYTMHLEKKEGDFITVYYDNGLCNFSGLNETLVNNEPVYSDVILCSAALNIKAGSQADHADLLYNGSLKLKVNDQQLGLDKENSVENLYSFGDTCMHPLIGINYIGALKGNRNFIVFASQWATNKVGSTAVLRVFEYDSDGIHEISFRTPKVTAKNNGTRKVLLEIPGYNAHTSVFLDEETYAARKSQLEDIFSGEAVHHTLTWQCKDFDNDGYNELRIEKLVYVGPWIYLCHFNTYYKNINGVFTPYKAAFGSIDY